MQRLRDQVLADLRSIRIRRIDQIHAEIRQPLQNALRLLAIFRLAPDAVAVIRIAPNPSRCTVRSPPMEKVPLAFAFGVAFGVLIPRWTRFRREKLPRLMPSS